jgi:hypothetical protein
MKNKINTAYILSVILVITQLVYKIWVELPKSQDLLVNYWFVEPVFLVRNPGVGCVDTSDGYEEQNRFSCRRVCWNIEWFYWSHVPVFGSLRSLCGWNHHIYSGAYDFILQLQGIQKTWMRYGIYLA